MNQIDKILGCLLGAAAGDAMGAATAIRTRQQIEEFFGGYVIDFHTPPSDTFARGNTPGQITDDFSIAYMTCEEILKNNGAINSEIATKALLAWADVEGYFTRFAGPTTRAAISKLRGETVMRPEGFTTVNENSQASNGAAMKASPIALFSKGDVSRAITDSITVCKVTHNNNNALAGGCAVAAATAEALNDGANLFSVVKAGLYGAVEGDRLALEQVPVVAACSIEKKMKLAISIGLTANSLSDAIDEIADIIGTGLAAAEAVPAAFGLMVAADGDTVKAIEAAVNIGNDTDTVAIMIGGILGALNGVGSMPDSWLALINKANGYNLEETAKKIAAI